MISVFAPDAKLEMSEGSQTHVHANVLGPRLKGLPVGPMMGGGGGYICLVMYFALSFGLLFVCELLGMPQLSGPLTFWLSRAAKRGARSDATSLRAPKFLGLNFHRSGTPVAP